MALGREMNLSEIQRSTDIGVPLQDALTMRISLPEARYKKPEQQVALRPAVLRLLLGLGASAATVRLIHPCSTILSRLIR